MWSSKSYFWPKLHINCSIFQTLEYFSEVFFILPEKRREPCNYHSILFSGLNRPRHPNANGLPAVREVCLTGKRTLAPILELVCTDSCLKSGFTLFVHPLCSRRSNLLLGHGDYLGFSCLRDQATSTFIDWTILIC